MPGFHAQAAPQPLAEAVRSSGQVFVLWGDPGEAGQGVELTRAVELHPHYLSIHVNPGEAKPTGGDGGGKLGKDDRRRHVRGRGGGRSQTN